MRLLLGTHYHPAGATGLRRQAAARASLLQLRRVELVNLQFPDAVIEVSGVPTVPELHSDSIKATGHNGVRKPIGSECFQRLSEQAEQQGCEYFAWVNADIHVTQAAVDRVLESELDAVIFTRMDFSGVTGTDTRPFWGGQDMFAFRVNWWKENAHRFRPYVNSEAYWDNVYTAVTLCHGRSELLNRSGLIRHEEHPRAWAQSPFADYNFRLASLDCAYYRMWDRYERRVLALLGEGSYEAAEPALQQRIFRWPPPVPELLRHWFSQFRVKAGWL